MTSSCVDAPDDYVGETSIRFHVLLLSGEADPFARIDMLREAVGLLKSAELVTYPGIGHGLTRSATVFNDALDRVAALARQGA